MGDSSSNALLSHLWNYEDCVIPKYATLSIVGSRAKFHFDIPMFGYTKKKSQPERFLSFKMSSLPNIQHNKSFYNNHSTPSNIFSLLQLNSYLIKRTLERIPHHKAAHGVAGLPRGGPFVATHEGYPSRVALYFLKKILNIFKWKFLNKKIMYKNISHKKKSAKRKENGNKFGSSK